MSRRRAVYAICLALGFILAFAARISFNDDLSGMDLTCGNYDGIDYHWLAKNLCRGRGYHTFSGTGHGCHLLRPPGYPIYAAAVYCIAGMGFASLKIADTLLSALSAVMAALIARELAGRKAALLALLIAALYRPAAFFATRIFSENLFCFLMLLSIALMIRHKDKRWAYAAAGGISGYLILTRPVWLGVATFILAWIIVSRKRRIIQASCFLIGIAVALTPWVIYCRATLGMPVSPIMLSSLRGAYSSWAAHNPAAGDFTQIGTGPGRDPEHEYTKLVLLQFREWRLPETEYMATVSAEAMRFLKEDPARCIKLGLKRVYRSWLGSGILDGQGTIRPDTGKNPYGVLYWKGRILNPAVYVGDEEIIEQLPFRRELRVLGVHVPLLSFEGVFYLMVLSLLACAALNARHLAARTVGALRRYSLLLAIAVGYTVTTIFATAIQRFRLPLEYIVIIIAGAGIACALSPLLLFFGAAIRAAGIRIPGDAAEPLLKPGRRIPRAIIWLAVGAVIAALAARCAYNVQSFRASVVAQCAVSVSDADVLSRMGRSSQEAHGAPDYGTVWRRQMEGAGDLGEMLGSTVLWRGEATWINLPSRADFQGEYYLRQAQEKFTPEMENPGFLRLIVDSYRDPDSIGSGRAIVVAPGKVLERLTEGDHIAVLGRLAGTDFVVGSMIVCAEEVLILNQAGP